jgi:hypothetical protein
MMDTTTSGEQAASQIAASTPPDTTQAPDSMPNQPAVGSTPTPATPAATPNAPAAGGTEADNSVTLGGDGTVSQPSLPDRVYHGILKALGGSNDVQLARDPSTGKMVATTVAKTPGSQWKQIIAGALTGLAASGKAGVGPGQKERALALGVGGGQQMVQQQQQSKVDQANQDYDEQQKAIVRKAQLQQMAVQTAASSFSLERAKVDASTLDAKMTNDHMAWLKDNGGVDVGTFKDFAAVGAYAKNDPTLAADIAHGRIAVMPNIQTTTDKDGTTHSTVNGIDVARVPEGWGDQLNDKDLPIQRMIPGKDGKPPTWETETIPAGTIKNSDYNTAVLATVNQQAKMASDVVENDYKQAQIKKTNADAEFARTEAGKTAAETRQLNEASSQNDIESNAQQLVNGTMDPANLSKRSKSYDATLAAANRLSLQQSGQPFDPAKAAGDYKFATTAVTKNTLNYLNSLVGKDNKSGNLGAVVSMSQALKQSKFPALNDVSQWAKLQDGNPQVAAYRAALTETADQIAKILQGGGSGNGTSDAKLKQAGELLNKGFNANQMAATADTLRVLLGNRKQETIGDNRYLMRWYGAPQYVTVTDPTGAVHTFPDQASANNFKKAANIQ